MKEIDYLLWMMWITEQLHYQKVIKNIKIMLDISKAKEYNNKVRLIESIAL